MNGLILEPAAPPAPAMDCEAADLPINSEDPAQTFGAVLEQAVTPKKDSSETQESSELENSKPEEKLDEKKNVSSALLLAFCPIPVPAAEMLKPVETSPVAPPVSDKPGTSAEAVSDLRLSEMSALSQDLAQALQPRPVGSIPSSPAAGKGSIELDPSLFEPASGEIALDTPGPQPAQQAAEGSSDGTLVAQLEKQMKNAEKSAEFAPAIEQKMPVRDVLRRILHDSVRLDSTYSAPRSDSAQEGSSSVEIASEITPVKAANAVEVIEGIRAEVVALRQRGDATVSVVLRPSNGGELQVSLSIARDGTVRAVAHCERGDFQALSAQWPQLQHSLGAQGIRMADLSSGGNFNSHNFSDASSQSFNRGQNSHEQNQQPAAAFEEEWSGQPPRPAMTKPSFEHAVARAERRWQSWA